MKLAVVGSINMDMTVTAERIPGKGETLRGDSVSSIPGGKGANQAVAMAKLGAEVEMFGCVGDDGNGEMLLENLKRAGVKTDHIRVLKDVPTGIAMITVAENDNTIVVIPGANGKMDRGYADSIRNESDCRVILCVVFCTILPFRGCRREIIACHQAGNAAKQICYGVSFFHLVLLLNRHHIHLLIF